MIKIVDGINAEIEKLMQEQRERPRQAVKRRALGLPGVVGLTLDYLAAWKMKQEAKLQ